MILGLEIGLAIFGLIALFRGKLTLSKNKVVEGVPARLLGLLALTPLPLVLVVGIAYVALSNPKNPEKFAEDNKTTLMVVEAVTVIGVAVLVFGIGAVVGTNPAEARRKRRRDEEYDEDDEDDYERPRRRQRDEDEDEGDDDRPRRRRRDDDEEDGDYDRPRRR